MKRESCHLSSPTYAFHLKVNECKGEGELVGPSGVNGHLNGFDILGEPIGTRKNVKLADGIRDVMDVMVIAHSPL